MKSKARVAGTSVRLLAAAACFLLFFNGYKQAGPAKSKFKRLGEGAETIDLTVESPAVETSRFKEVAGDKRVARWAAWWKACLPGFDISEMEYAGTHPMAEERIEPLSPRMTEGPRRIFYIKSPDGRFVLNPYYRRLKFEKEDDAWQPYIELPCGVALYDAKSKEGKNILECSALEGIDAAFWRDANTIVLMGYESVTREMNVECEGTHTCVSPAIWIVDLKARSIEEQRGAVVPRKGAPCELGGYLKVALPEFFQEEKKK